MSPDPRAARFRGWPTAWLIVLLFLATTLPRLAAADPPPTTITTIVPGVEYLHERVAAGPLSIHQIKMDLARQDLRVVVSLANGAVLGRQTVRAQVAALPHGLGRPVAAINGDYFEMGKTGDPRYAGALEGLHLARGELVHGPMGNAFWVDDAGRPHLSDRAESRLTLTWPDGSTIACGLNSSTTAHKSEVGARDVVVFTPAFGSSTRTDSGRELVLTRAPGSPWLPVRAGGCYTGIVQAARHEGDTRIGPDTLVVSVVSNVTAKLPPLRVGDRVVFTAEVRPELAGVQEGIGAGPILVWEGQSRAATLDKENLAPRTAIGFNATHLFLVVVDGRQPGLSVGISLADLADLLARFGCTAALNMDGGGSSTLWIDGAVRNSPSDAAGERPVGNALVIVRTTRPAASE